MGRGQGEYIKPAGLVPVPLVKAGSNLVNSVWLLATKTMNWTRHAVPFSLM